MISIFANIRINDHERLEHFKDSFYSFSEMSDDWVINIRGSLRKEAVAFLELELKGKLNLFELLDERSGWIKNALLMVPVAKHDYVLLWNEDHINLLSKWETEEIINEAINANVDYLHYGHFEHWRNKFDRVMQSGVIKRGKSIDFADVTKENISLFFPEQKRECITSSPAIFRKEFLIKIMKIEGRKLPFFLTHNIRRVIALIGRFNRKINQKRVFDVLNNTFFFHKLPRFVKQTPFELEITQDRLYILPVRVASSHEEFFACIDDDVNKDGSMDGYQLIKRGLYPVRGLLVVEKEIPSNMRILDKMVLRKEEKFADRYYINQTRTNEPLRAVLLVSGKVEIKSGKEIFVVGSHQPIGFYPNISHTIMALEDASVEIYTSAPIGAKIVHPGNQLYNYQK
ncbi:MAG: hypothetical protein WBC83_00875 [Minisyncoccia bacterium]